MSTQRPAKRLKIEVQILTKPRKTIVHEKAHKANTLESKNDEDDDDVVIIDPPPKNEHKSSKSYSINGSRTQIPPLRAEPFTFTLSNGVAPPSKPKQPSTLDSSDSSKKRRRFLKRLDAINAANRPEPPIRLCNTIDDSTPPLEFQFIRKSVLRPGVHKVSEEAMYGCSCRPENGRNVGCEYTSCECLEQAARRPDGKKRFPYHCTAQRSGCLQDFYLNSRNHIFECNRLCNCPAHCKNKVVQWGRQVELEIFKTRDRGWGLRCPVDLKKGQFIDVYKGEIITSAEADEREERRRGKDSYLYTMDKFALDMDIPPDKLYVVDGEFMGGPTRFMNHSCDPNCRQFTVSYNHADAYIYDLALFAVRSIPAGEELTFNYLDKEEEEGEEDGDDDADYEDDDDGGRQEGGRGEGERRRKKKRGVNARSARDKEKPVVVNGTGDAARKDGNRHEMTKCLCGSANCKGYLWI